MSLVLLLSVYSQTAKNGILTLGQVIAGDLGDYGERRLEQERILHAMIKDRKLTAFPSLVVASDYTAGIEALAQCQGLGQLRPVPHATVVLSDAAKDDLSDITARRRLQHSRTTCH